MIEMSDYTRDFRKLDIYHDSYIPSPTDLYVIMPKYTYAICLKVIRHTDSSALSSVTEENATVLGVHPRLLYCSRSFEQHSPIAQHRSRKVSEDVGLCRA